VWNDAVKAQSRYCSGNFLEGLRKTMRILFRIASSLVKSTALPLCQRDWYHHIISKVAMVRSYQLPRFSMYPESGGRKFLRNVGNHQRNYTTSYPRISTSNLKFFIIVSFTSCCPHRLGLIRGSTNQSCGWHNFIFFNTYTISIEAMISRHE
jgi:hypothetical protein